MKVKNISTKIIGIGSATILPGETKEIEPGYAKNPTIKVFEGLGLIQCSGSAGKQEVAVNTQESGNDAEANEETHRADLLAEVNAGVDVERLGAIARELGVNPATVKSQAGLLKKVKAELSK